MGLPALQRLMSMQRDRRLQQIQPRNGLIASLDKRKELTCLQEDKPPGGKKLRRLGPSLPENIQCITNAEKLTLLNVAYSMHNLGMDCILQSPYKAVTSLLRKATNKSYGKDLLCTMLSLTTTMHCTSRKLLLPNEIWGHIHSLLSVRDAARAACVSHTFLRSWRCHPNLTFRLETLVDENQYRENKISDEISTDLITKIDHILKNHSGIGVKALKLEIHDVANISTSYLNDWLSLGVRPGIEELALSLHSDVEYNFPCSILLGGSANSIRNLHLSCCVFRPMAGFSCSRSLTSLELYEVRITGDELWCLLSSSFALEELIIMDCDEIISLKIPYLLQRLSRLVLCECENLEVVKSKAPNLSNFVYTGGVVELSFGDTMRDLNIVGSCWNLVHYARATLPQMVPNLEALDITSSLVGDIPVLPSKFLHLKHLCISFMVSSGSFCPGYDYLSLVSFLDACPSLETFTLCVTQHSMEHDSVLGDSSHLRQMPGHCHGKIKEVQIIGFCSAKSMVELTCHILANAVSLQYLTLDTVCYDLRCSDSKSSRCIGVNKHMIMEARKTLLVVERYILQKVPSTVELKIVEPCRRCKAVKN